MSTRTEVTSALVEIIREAVPSVPWTVNVTGSNVSKGIEGTLSCDRVDFSQEARDIIFATATFTIYVVDMSGNEEIEDIGDILFDALNCTDANGTCLICSVKSIVYGAPRGNTKASALLMELEAEYQV